LVLGRAWYDDTADYFLRMKTFVDDEGLDALVELWASADAVSLPRALFRLFQIREQIVRNPEAVSHLLNVGVEVLHTIDPVVVRAEVPVTAQTMLGIIDEILSGSFSGDLAAELERASSLSHLVSAGLLAIVAGPGDEEHLNALSSLAWGDVARELANCAVRERKGLLS
jgi:hypothetical protein